MEERAKRFSCVCLQKKTVGGGKEPGQRNAVFSHVFLKYVYIT